MNDFQLLLAGMQLGGIIVGIAAYAIMAYEAPRKSFSKSEQKQFQDILSGFNQAMSQSRKDAN